MLRYFLGKLLYLPLGILLLTLLSFALGRLTLGDSVQQRMEAEGVRVSRNDLQSYERNYRYVARRMQQDLPPFYFTFTNAAFPDTFQRVVFSERRRALRELARTYGNWPRVQAYYRAVLAARDSEVPRLRLSARRLLSNGDPDFVRRQVSELGGVSAAGELTERHREMVAGQRRSDLLWPRMYWHGVENQYHRYLTGLLHGDFGISYATRRPVAQEIAIALPRTALLNGLALLVVYLLAVPLGLYMARYAGSRFDRMSTFLTFLAFGVPSFWVATLLANSLTSEIHGMDWFPTMGFGDPRPGAGWGEALVVHAKHLFLPVLCLAYPSFAYVSRHQRAAALAELEKPYVKTARMKGLSGSQVLWKHVFRNAAFPLVTMLGSLLPALLAGSVLIERIFNLPGMGQLLYESATARDWPAITALVLVNGVLTIFGLVLADIGYAVLDPRVRLGKRPPS